MKLEFAILAEAVSLSGDKLYIHGAPIKRFAVPQLPWASPLGIALSFSAPLTEAGEEHVIAFRLSGPAGDPHIVTSPPLPLVLPTVAEEPGRGEINAIAALGAGMVLFVAAGTHRIELNLDHEPLVVLEFEVTLDPVLRDRMMHFEEAEEPLPPASNAEAG